MDAIFSGYLLCVLVKKALSIEADMQLHFMCEAGNESYSFAIQ